MNNCCICKTPIPGLICNLCFKLWPKGLGFAEYVKRGRKNNVEE